MLDYTTLNLKKKLPPDSVCNEERYDLLSQTISNVDVKVKDVIIVNKYYVARPDLISLAIYGDDKYADFICKYNGISNPFELNENDIIFIPNYSDFNSMLDDETKASEIIDDSKQNNISDTKSQWQKESNERRSPAQQVVGETNFVIDKSLGVVFY